MVDNVYKVITKLIIIPTTPSDFGAYKCVAKNSIGQAEKFIYLYREFKYLNRRKLLCVVVVSQPIKMKLYVPSNNNTLQQ